MMKSILIILLSLILVISGSAQTRNVVVGTNGAVVQPTNFWSADITNARSGLGLGSAATNPASVFQPASSVLTNLSSNNGSSLTNIQASNIVGVISITSPTVNFTNIIGTLGISRGGTGATNASSARQNLGSTTIGDALFIATNAESARNIIGALSPSGDASSLTNFPESLLRTNGNASGLTNILANNITGVVSKASNVTGIIEITNGGTGATNDSTVRANIGLGATWLTNTNVTNFRTDIDLDWSALTNTNSSIELIGVNSNAEVVINTGTNILTFTNQVNFSSVINGTVALASNVTGTIAISNGGTGATNAAGARTNLGLVWTGLTNTNASGFRSALELSASWLTNTNVTNFRTAVELGEFNIVQFEGVVANAIYGGTNTTNDIVLDTQNFAIYGGTVQVFNWDTNFVNFNVPVQFNNTTNAATTRTNLGLGWTALTNTNVGTGLVSVNTNGEVVSPTNFWDVAPIQTLVQNFLPAVNATNNATNARTLYIYSMALSTVGVTNVVTLPTNTATKNGDEVTVIHMAPTSSVTAVRQLGQTNNLITINKTDESVKFIYENNTWTNFHNISFVEPIQFSGTNASANAAASRTNLGFSGTGQDSFIGGGRFNEASGQGSSVLGGSYNIASGVWSTVVGGNGNTSTNYSLSGGRQARATNVGSFVWADSSGNPVVDFSSTNDNSFNVRSIGGMKLDLGTNGISFRGTFADESAAATRTNLGLGATWLTNTNVTDFRTAIGLGETNSPLFQSVKITNNAAFIDVTSYGIIGYNAEIDLEEKDLTAGSGYDWNFSGSGIVAAGAIEFVNSTNAATTRTNLGLGFSALTNTSVTNFQKAIFYTNTAPSNIGGNLGSIAAWIEIVASNGVTYKIPAYTNVP